MYLYINTNGSVVSNLKFIMKNSFLYLSLAASVLMLSCTQNTGKNSELKDTLGGINDTLANKSCFVAIDAKDTANLVFTTSDKGKITGHLVINYIDKAINEGEITGAYKGDTLFVDYTFRIGTGNKTLYKNPLAFLKKDGKLILGVGQIETTLGRSYFVKGKAISFEKGRFTFAPVDCR